MKTNLLTVVVLSLLTSVVHASSAAIDSGATVKNRANAISQRFPLPPESVGAKSFEIRDAATAALVVDDAGVAPTSGLVVSLETATGCAATLFDSAVATGLTLASAGRQLVVPLYGSDTSGVLGVKVREYRWPIQFNKGLVIYQTPASCQSVVHWMRGDGSLK